MPSVKELREQRGQLEARFQAIVNQAEAENRDLTAEEDATVNQINTDDLALKNRIERQEKLAALGKELDEPADKRFQGRGSLAGDDSRGSVVGDSEQDALALQGWCRHQMGEEITAEQEAACQAVGMNPRSQKLNIALNNRWADFRNQWKNGLTTPNPGKGGTLVAPSFAGKLEQALLQFGVMLQVAELMDTETGAEMPYPTINDTTNRGVLVSELQEASEVDVTTGGVVFRAHEMTSGVVVVSQSMLDDSAFNLVQILSTALGERLGRGISYQCTLGETANGPRGIVPRSTAGPTTAGATAITGDEVLDLIAAVDPAYRSDPSFGLMAHDVVWTALRKLKATDGSYLWQRSLAEGQPDRFGGHPVWTNQDMASSIAANAKTILAGAFNRYKIRRVRSITLRRMTDKYATQNADGFVAFVRFDGDLVNAGTNPIKHLLQHA